MDRVIGQLLIDARISGGFNDEHAPATGTFKLEGWDEKPYEERDGGRKLTEAHVKADVLR